MIKEYEIIVAGQTKFCEVDTDQCDLDWQQLQKLMNNPYSRSHLKVVQEVQNRLARNSD